MTDTSNGAPPSSEPPPSLREIAEQAYDAIETAETTSEVSDEPLAQDGQPRDKSGRWVAKEPSEPGEAIVPPVDPAPATDKISETRAPTPDPAAAEAARSNQAPEHWSAEDKATFAKLPQEGQAFLLKRHGEMEAEFTRKSQASAGAVQFTQSLAPVFTDRRLQQSLQQAGLNPTQAIHEWAGLHLRAMSPNLPDKFNVLVDMTQRMGLDPARIFVGLNRQPIPEGLAEADLKDPAVKFFADHLGQATARINALENQSQQQRAAEQQARQQTENQHARQGIDQFADETGADGQPLRPYFNTVLPIIIDLARANPQRDLVEAYDYACWAHPDVRKQLLADERMRVQSQHDVQKARIAQRGNARGLTAPVARPQSTNGASRGTLRDVIEASAEEIGF